MIKPGQTPSKEQQHVINAVTGLANALLDGWGRGSGETWVREYIARKIIHDDKDPVMREVLISE